MIRLRLNKNMEFLDFNSLLQVNATKSFLHDEYARKCDRKLLKKVIGEDDALDYFLSFRIERNVTVDQYFQKYPERQKYWSNLFDQDPQFYYTIICFYIEQGLMNEVLFASDYISHADCIAVSGEFILRKALKTGNPKMVQLGYYMVFVYWFENFYFDQNGYHTIGQISELSKLDDILIKYLTLNSNNRPTGTCKNESVQPYRNVEFMNELKSLVFA